MTLAEQGAADLFIGPIHPFATCPGVHAMSAIRVQTGLVVLALNLAAVDPGCVKT